MIKLLLALAALGFAASVSAAPPACVDGRELDGLSLEVTFVPKDGTPALTYTLSYDECHVEIPRDEPPAPSYAQRTYKAGKASLLAYTNEGAARSRLSISLPDGRSAYVDIDVDDAALASGKPVNLGTVLLVRGTDEQGRGGSVLSTSGTIRALPKAP